jgi:acyl-CoA dehydrogenase
MIEATEQARLLDLPGAYVELQREARAVAAEAAPFAARADEADSIDPDMRRLLAASGLAAVAVPRQFGGRYERVDSLAMTVVREAFAGTSAHLDSLFAMQGIASYAISVGATDPVRKSWLPRIATLEAIPAIGLTEPDVGSDLRAITTKVTQDGNELVISGRKSFITNAGDADVYTILATEGEGFSLVTVPGDAAGLSIERPFQITAPHVLGDVLLDDVRVPVDHRVGEPGGGFRLVLAVLGTFRVSVAGAAIGVAQAALDEAVAHATVRKSFGGPLVRVGPVPTMLALSWTEIEAARALAYRAAAAAAVDPHANLYLSSMAKVFATEAACRVVDRCVQVMGRFGLVRGSVIERLFRTARPMRIYEGSTEVILDSLAKQLIKAARS